MLNVAKLGLISMKGLFVMGITIFIGVILLILISTGSEAAIITVDDDGPAMHSRIQDAINASIDGDTVYVYNGTYYENIIVNRTINLTGENRSNTVINGGGIGKVVWIVSDWVNVTGFNIESSGMNISDAGVRLDGVENCNISNNNISHNKEMGIHFNHSHSNILANNIFIYNWESGIYLEYADFNILRNNWVDTNGNGIGIFHSSYEVIELNNVSKHGGYGIYFSYSGNSSVKNNTISDNAAGGITAGYSTNLTVCWNLVKREVYSCAYGVALWGCDENIIFNNTFEGNGYGVYLSFSDRNDIMNNYIFGSTNRAIELIDSHENGMINNSGNNNIEAFWLKNCNYNKIIDNTFSLLGGSAIYSENSNWTIIMGNDFSEDYYWGMYFSWCSFNNITNNNLSETSGLPPFTGHGIYMENCQNNNISNNTISLVEGNGIHLLSSSDNTITLNNISHNQLGINLSYSWDNRIYHNNLIDNTEQAYDNSDNGNQWNCTYPIGGNYWSDYIGPDDFRGPNQDQPGPDGIGDIPYIIDANSLDNYPLMQPYEPPSALNNPPVITTIDVDTAYEELLYLVDYEAYDYEGDPLNWTLLTNASWLDIDNITGILSGTPSSSDIGSYWVNVSVEDGKGGMDYHNFILTVVEKPVLNLDTLEKFTTIQEAIDDPDTLNGHTIWVNEGIYYENVVVYKTINLIGENKETTIINCSKNGTVLKIVANWVNITGFTFESSGHGREYAGIGVESDYNNISNNIMTLNYEGIFLYPSANDNIIYGNLITNNRHGIWLNSSSNNHIFSNEIHSKSWEGIALFSGCYNNIVTKNIVSSVDCGIYVYESYDNIIFHNDISLTDTMGIRILSSERNNISSNNISSNIGYGINLRYSDENNITKNIIINNSHGIYVYSSHQNNIICNYISDNIDYGLYLISSSSNRIARNNIIDNANQSYDDRADNSWNYSYPSGGNYWSDYSGVDNFNGPNQDIQGADGIGDTPYVIDSDSRDNYPLMVHWENYYTLDLVPPETAHNYDGVWHTTEFIINLTATDDMSGVNETYYRINNGSTQTISIHGHPLISTESENNTLEYWSTDYAGNEEEHKFLYEIELDKTHPSTTDDYDGLVHYNDFTITLSAFEVGSGIDEIFYRINNGAVRSVGEDGQPLITVENENNTLEYWSVDVAGNIEKHNFLYNIKLNKTYPDLTLASEDIIFSKPRLIEGNEVYINATIHNIGNLSAQATVKFYDGEPGTGILIGEIILIVEDQDTALASILWTPILGDHIICVIIEESIPEEPYTGNNVANISMTVEIPPVLILSMGDFNVFRFESGEERTVPVYVSCYNNSATNVRLIVLDDRGLNITVVTPPQNMSKDGSFIFYLRIKVPILEENQEYKEEDILLQVTSDEVSSNQEYMDIVVGRSAAEMFNWIILLGGALAGAGAVGILGGTEVGKYALFAATMSLYTRLTKKDVLDQETRGMIRGYIMANPGEHYNAIKRALGLKNGTLAYHLKTLEKENLIKSARDGRYKRFYPPSMKVPEEVITLNKAQELIMGQIIDNPGISQKELSDAVGLSTSTVNYHISVMANAGFVRVERKGKHTMCYPEDEAS